METAWADATASALWSNAETLGAARIVMAILPAPAERVRRVAQELRSRPGSVVMLASSGEKPQLFCARADGIDLDAAALLKAALAEVGGRGGGRPDWAQGGAADETAVERALQFARHRVRATPHS